MMLRNDAANKTAYLKEENVGGFTTCLTKQSLVIGGYDESAGGAGNCNTVVEGLAQYLKESGYKMFEYLKTQSKAWNTNSTILR